MTLSVLALAALLVHAPYGDVVTPRSGIELRKSATVAPGEYTLVAEGERQPILRVHGDDITLDFTNVKLIGSNDPTKPDQFTGVAIEVIDSKNVTIKNLNARGYKFAIVARNSPGLNVEDCNFSYNYRQRLRSTPEREDESDWLSYHDNETDQWMRYGAAIYLNHCDDSRIVRCTVHNGQNALMLTNCDHVHVRGNDFSFNSGVGVGLYRSSNNFVRNNRLNWCVRGYSHGIYNRGQDSAAILVYEQSNDNAFTYNSGTHSGDGFFLWAGNSTMKTGKGGCNNNSITENDFSCAVANGIEATFSKNIFTNNLLEECDYGIWAGYSFESLFATNRIRNSKCAAIAIEHGHDNEIVLNEIDGPGIGIKLWANAKQDPEWGYPKHRDTKSHRYEIYANKFGDTLQPVLWLRDTGEIRCQQIEESNIHREGTVDGLKFVKDASTTQPAGAFSAEMDTQLPPDHPRGRKYMNIDDYGPYDFRRPAVIRSSVPKEPGPVELEFLGPTGKWTLKSSENVRDIEAKSGDVPGKLTITPIDPAQPTKIEFEYFGAETTTRFGEVIPAGKAVCFEYQGMPLLKKN